jgi:hypothetical protein
MALPRSSLQAGCPTCTHLPPSLPPWFAGFFDWAARCSVWLDWFSETGLMSAPSSPGTSGAGGDSQGMLRFQSDAPRLCVASLMLLLTGLGGAWNVGFLVGGGLDRSQGCSHARRSLVSLR